MIKIGDNMEKITKLPDNLLIETQLTETQVQLLVDQINRFIALQAKERKKTSPILDGEGKIFLREGTLIHGISRFSVSTIDSISKTGILTGQAIGIAEDGETYYCADFHRVPKDESLSEFNDTFTYIDGRNPFGNGKRGGYTIAFIIEPSEEIAEITSYDCYREGTLASDITKSFVNLRGLPIEDKSTAASILYGVPRQAFSGIVLGDDLFMQKEVLELIIKTFPECYVATIHGDIIYDPTRDTIEIALLRGELYGSKVQVQRTSKELEAERKRRMENMNRNKQLVDTILDLVINSCSLEDGARVLIDNQLFQGTIEQAMEYISSKKGTGLKQ